LSALVWRLATPTFTDPLQVFSQEAVLRTSN